MENGNKAIDYEINSEKSYHVEITNKNTGKSESYDTDVFFGVVKLDGGCQCISLTNAPAPDIAEALKVLETIVKVHLKNGEIDLFYKLLTFAEKAGLVNDDD